MLRRMDPERIHAYLQAACAGLGFDVGEVWFSSNETGTSTSTVATIGKNSNSEKYFCFAYAKCMCDFFPSLLWVNRY